MENKKHKKQTQAVEPCQKCNAMPILYACENENTHGWKAIATCPVCGFRRQKNANFPLKALTAVLKLWNWKMTEYE